MIKIIRVLQCFLDFLKYVFICPVLVIPAVVRAGRYIKLYFQNRSLTKIFLHLNLDNLKSEKKSIRFQDMMGLKLSF